MYVYMDKEKRFLSTERFEGLTNFRWLDVIIHHVASVFGTSLCSKNFILV